MKEIDIGLEKEVKIIAGSHNIIVIEKLYGPTFAEDLVIKFGEELEWEVSDYISKQKIREAIISAFEKGSLISRAEIREILTKELGL